MKLVIKPDATAASAYVADYIAAKVTNIATPVLGLPTGGTPLKVYELLVKKYQQDLLSFKNVTTFNMDEYVGLNATHDSSYAHFMYEHLFNHTDFNQPNINLLDGVCSDITAECAAYEEKIAAKGGIDLFFGGVGVDGHIAFNEQFSSLSSRTRCVRLNNTTIKQNARFFDNQTSLVPTHALSVGVGTILDAKEVMVLATGEAKADAIAAAIDGSINHKCTISALQSHPHAMIVCDQLAAMKLSKEALAYFGE